MEDKKKSQRDFQPKNPVHQMKIYEEFVVKESKYSNRNKTNEYTINPFTCKYSFISHYFSSIKHIRKT